MANEKLSVVEEARKRYLVAKEAFDSSRQLAIDDTKFALGDSDNGWQWPETIYRSRSLVEQRPCLTVNITAQHCNQIINNIRMNRPQCRVLPVDSQADKKTAEILAGLIRNIQTSSNAEDAHDVAAEHAIYGGEGYWRVITEYESERSFDQVIKIKTIQNPLLVYIDPFCKELDKSDAEWGFIFEDITKEQARREHPNITPESWTDDKNGWVTAETIRRAEYFYCVYEDDEACLMTDGSTILRSELHDDLASLVVKTRKTKVTRWKWALLVGGEDKPVEERDWIGKYLPIVSVVGKEVNVNGEIVRKGVVRDLKDPARMVNYSYSAAVETIALQNRVPYMAPIEAIEGFEDIWQAANIENRAYLPYNAFDESGNAIPRPERQQPAVMPTAQVQMLQLSTEQMRAASGQQNANFGIKSEAVSGVGIQRLKAQGEVATFHFPDNQVRGIRYEAQILIDLIPKIYDTNRVVRILGLDGKDSQAILDPNMPQAYAEITADDVQKIFNPTVGMYDVVIDTGPSYQTQRQEASQVMSDIAGRDPNFMHLAGDIFWQAMDVPMADQLAKRYEKALPPELQDQKGQANIPPQVQAQMAKMQDQIKQMGDALNNASEQVDKLEADQEYKYKELMVKGYDAETKRIQAVGAGMTPEQVQAIVMQTLQQTLTAPNINQQIGEDLQEYEQQESHEMSESHQTEMIEPNEGQMQ